MKNGLTYLFLLLFFILAWPVSAAAGLQAIPATVKRLVYNAQQEMQKQEYQKAVGRLSDYLVKQPQKSHYLIEFTLGNAYTGLNQIKEAKRHYHRATKLNPDYTAAWQNLGKCCFDLELYEQAGAAMLEAYELGKEQHPTRLYYAAIGYLLAGQAEKSRPLLERLIADSGKPPKSEWIEAYLQVCLDLNETDKALKLIKRLLANDQNKARWWKLLAQLELQKNNYRQATAALEIYGYLQPLEIKELKLLGDLYLTIGAPVKAAENYACLCRREPLAKYQAKLARAWFAAHHYKTALAVLQKALSRQPDAGLWFLKGQILYEQNCYAEACDAFAEADDLTATANGKALMMMAYCSINLEEYGYATAILKRACRCPHTGTKAQKLLKQLDQSSANR
ncbi:MAG: tetratricopeptide repeat protein [Pseudomonadota bacterium]|nr:tetratricopeptide repeat protein [Pseudomonadota bacterium]